MNNEEKIFSLLEKMYIEINKRLEGMDKRFESIESQMATKEELQSTKKEVQKLSQQLTRIEIVHGDKLAGLLDGYKQNTEILKNHAAQLDRIEDKLESHDIKISVLDKRRKAKL